MRSIIPVFFLLIICSSKAQQLDRFTIEVDYVTKFSVGGETREDIVYQPGVSANVPKNSKFRNPVHGLNFTLNYSLPKLFLQVLVRDIIL